MDRAEADALVDAIWVTLLRANGRVRRDRKGRKRPVKGRFKVPIMIAMGLWPDSDRREILLWRIGEDEGAEEWVKMFLGKREGNGGASVGEPPPAGYEDDDALPF